MRVTQWAKVHETHESRKLVNLRYLCLPNKHDGEGYNLIMLNKNGPTIFAAWILILQVASKCEVRGLLHNSAGLPVTSAGLAAKTRAPKEIFDLAIPFLLQIGWLTRVSAESAETPAESPDVPAESAASGEGRREDKIGGDGIRGEGKAASPPARKRAPSFSVSEFPELLNTPEFIAAWRIFEQHRIEKHEAIPSKNDLLTQTACKMALKRLSEFGLPRAIAALNYTVSMGWTGIREQSDYGAGNRQGGGIQGIKRAADAHRPDRDF